MEVIGTGEMLDRSNFNLIIPIVGIHMETVLYVNLNGL